MKPTLLLPLICVVFFSCKKHNSVVNQFAFWPCPISNYDSVTTVSKLQGSWKWTRVVGGDGKVVSANKNVVVTFSVDGSYAIKQDDAVITSGTWKLKRTSVMNDGYELDIKEQTNCLSGPIQFCTNQVAFLAGFFDGPDNYFEKTD